jgi:hypothetical protein
MANINDKDAAALERFEAERARRLQEKIDSGEIVSETITVVCTRDEDAEEAKARARHPAPDDGRPVHREFLYIFTGVPRGQHLPGQAPPQTKASTAEGPALPSAEKPAGSGGVLSPSPPSQPVYVKVTVRNGDEDDPGQIAEAWYTIEDGLLVLRDSNDKHLTSRALLNGENPATLAKILLREREGQNDFQQPIHYPKLGFA